MIDRKTISDKIGRIRTDSGVSYKGLENILDDLYSSVTHCKDCIHHENGVCWSGKCHGDVEVSDNHYCGDAIRIGGQK